MAVDTHACCAGGGPPHAEEGFGGVLDERYLGHVICHADNPRRLLLRTHATVLMIMMSRW